MGGDNSKNDVKIIFYIFNTLSAVGGGVILFSIGVGTGVFMDMKIMDIMNIVFGLVFMIVGLNGYCGAKAENKKMLNSYSTVMSIRSIHDVITLVRWSKLNPAMMAAEVGLRDAAEDLLYKQIALFGFLMVETIVTMVTALLAMALAVNVKQDANNQQVRVAKPSSVC